MKTLRKTLSAVLLGVLSLNVQADHHGNKQICLDSGPQTPRDISNGYGLNSVEFPTAPPSSEMNLCNIHTHTQAEHRGPGFSIAVGDGKQGFACNASRTLTDAELTAAPGAYKGVKPGDTIEVHWVHTTCDAKPGPGLGACVPEGCTDPLLRVETQVFTLVNDPNALSFDELRYAGDLKSDDYHQAKNIPNIITNICCF